MNQGRFERPSPTALGRVVQSASTPTGLVDWANFDIAGAGDEDHTVGHASVGEPGKRCTITTTAHSRSLLTAERTVNTMKVLWDTSTAGRFSSAVVTLSEHSARNTKTVRLERPLG